jgi:hypothetical protein
MTRGLLVAAAVVALAGSPRAALAHGIGQRYDLPVPLWLYLYGAAAAVVLSFVLIGLFIGERGRGDRYPRLDVVRIGWVHRVLMSRPLAIALRVVSVALFLLVIASGLFGTQATNLNFAPTFVWVVWWVGMGFFVALLGNIWPLVNPWKIVFGWADALARRFGLAKGIEFHEPYPDRLGVWPALALYLAFIWMENVLAGAPEPRIVALAAIGYSLVTWAGMATYGSDVWLRNGEAFSVLFGILGRLAPTEIQVADRTVCADCSTACREVPECVDCEECARWSSPGARRLALRPWGVGLLRPVPVTLDRLAFVITMLASVTFDGLSVTQAWQELYLAALPAIRGLGGQNLVIFQTVGLALVTLLFFAVYRSAIKLSCLERIARFAGSGGAAGEIAARFVYSLVPIAFAYHLAHYATLFVGQSWVAVPLLSDPFGWGWDLFRTASWSVEIVLSAALVWYFQVAVIVAGHIVAVYLAHVLALRTVRDSRVALRSQVPLLGLMVAYTMTSLWILSQEVVAESDLASTVRILGFPF